MELMRRAAPGHVNLVRELAIDGWIVRRTT
jgi:hypothetical protein